MPLTSSNGYDRLDLDQIREDLNDLAHQKFGDDADVSDSAVIGMFMGVLSVIGDKYEKNGQALYLSQFALSSSGEPLDRNGADDGIQRKQASISQTTIQIDAVPGTEIPEETQFETEDGVLFETTADVVVGNAINVLDEDTGDQIPLINDDGEPCGRLVVEAVSVESGTDSNVGANTITVQAEPLDGIFAVTNPVAATGGVDIESDTEYRNRIMDNRINHPDSTENGIKTYLENKVTGVVQAKVVPNKTLQVDSYGNPPKSTHVYVIGGADQDVAEGIFRIDAAPSNTVGGITKTVLNASGDARQISFDRAASVPVFAKVTIGELDNFDSDNGINNIKDKMKEYVETLKMGDDVLFSKFFEYIWQIAGLSSVNVEIGSGTGSLKTSDFEIDEFQLATFDPDNVEVVVNG